MFLKAVLIECHGDSTTWGAVLDHVDHVQRRAFYTRAQTDPVRHCEDALRGRHGGLQCLNMGINQLSARELLLAGGGWPARMLASPADLVTLNLGINDAQLSIPPDDFLDSMCALVDGAIAAGKRVLVETPHPMVPDHKPNGDAAMASRLDRLATRLGDAMRARGIAVLDHHAMVPAMAGWQAQIPDGIHGTAGLYAAKGRALAEALSPIIDEILLHRAA